MTPRQRLVYWTISGLLAIGWINLLAYMLNPARVSHNFATPDGKPTVFDVLLLGALDLVLCFTLFMLTLGWIVIGLNQRRSAAAPTELPDPRTTRVAFITTYVPGSEPIDMLSRTLKAMQAVDYPHDTWVLDEGNDVEVQRLCDIIGVKYFTRKDKPHYNLVGSKFTPKSKGGNHNAWYDAHGAADYDIVAQIDTDFIPRRDFLTKTLPYFMDPDVAFVGTPQVYGNMKNFIARGAAQQTFLFYGGFLRGLAKIKSMMMIGANHVVRVRALADIGLYQPHLTEDLATGLRLHGAGWTSYYVPEALAIGEGPDTWSAFFKQQFRWAKGCNDLLFTQTRKSVRGMRPLQAVLYSWLQLYYLSGAVYGLGLVLLGLYFGFGWSAAHVELLPFLIAYAPLLLAFEVAMLWSQRFNIRPKRERGLYITGRILMIAVMPVFLAAFIAALKDRGKHTEFEVTPKGGVTTVVTIRKVKKRGKNPYRTHLLVSLYSVAILVIGVMVGRLEFSYIAWALLALASTVAIAIRPTLPRIRRKLREMSHELHLDINEELKHMLASSREWPSQEGYHDVLADLRRELSELTPARPQGRHASTEPVL